MRGAFLAAAGAGGSVVACAVGLAACVSSTMSDGKETSRDAASDASVDTAAEVVAELPETGSGDDAGPGDEGPGGCVPGDVSAYVPFWHPPARPHLSCSEAELDDLIADCFEPISTSTTCNGFQAASPGCWSCMVTPDTHAAWGPIIASSYTELLYGNFAGCLALRTGDQSNTGCGPRQQAARVCSEVACSGEACPTQSQLEVDAVIQCTADALTAGCAPYQNAAVSCAEGLLAQGGASAAAEQFCNGGNYGDLGTYYRALGPLFCGEEPDAGGGDGGDAGDTGD